MVELVLANSRGMVLHCLLCDSSILFRQANRDFKELHIWSNLKEPGIKVSSTSQSLFCIAFLPCLLLCVPEIHPTLVGYNILKYFVRLSKVVCTKLFTFYLVFSNFCSRAELCSGELCHLDQPMKIRPDSGQIRTIHLLLRNLNAILETHLMVTAWKIG